ncbi:MAG: sigma-70 family RNA polymerase sigma factor [Planctomycetes bacterium]|nr:sigma-70 family RNA polymerase sigma factor [Planctomycetota bacterium]
MNSSNEDRVRRASQGDVGAIDELLAQHLDGLRRYVRKHASPMVLARESSSDLVQSVCREVLRDLPKFEYRGEAAFRAWLFQTALRKLLDRHRFYRAEKRHPAHELAAADMSGLSRAELAGLASSLGSPSGVAAHGEELERLDRALARLSDDDRALVRAVFVDGLSHADIAARLGISESASRKQLSRALARLSKHLT